MASLQNLFTDGLQFVRATLLRLNLSQLRLPLPQQWDKSIVHWLKQPGSLQSLDLADTLVYNPTKHFFSDSLDSAFSSYRDSFNQPNKAFDYKRIE